tara:strand:+ start:135 stop:524 length:390 start_codon:yes stop_codon:yes gene_type:complete
MAYTALETIALIFILFSLLKIIIIAINKNLWVNSVSKKILKKPHPYAFLFLILSLIVLYYLLKELTIVQIIAASTFTVLLVGFGMLQYTKELGSVITKVQKDKHIIKKAWAYILIWIILLLWGLKEILL